MTRCRWFDLRLWSARRRLADFEERIDALEAGRPRIVQVSGLRYGQRCLPLSKWLAEIERRCAGHRLSYHGV